MKYEIYTVRASGEMRFEGIEDTLAEAKKWARDLRQDFGVKTVIKPAPKRKAAQKARGK